MCENERVSLGLRYGDSVFTCLAPPPATTTDPATVDIVGFVETAALLALVSNFA